jgi:hypothetical protein
MAWAEVQWYPSLFQSLGLKIDPSVDRWRQDHEMGWWGAAFFGEVDVALALGITMVMMRPADSDIEKRGVTLMGALPSQLQSFWPGARGRPESLRAVVSWAEKCDVRPCSLAFVHVVAMTFSALLPGTCPMKPGTLRAVLP